MKIQNLRARYLLGGIAVLVVGVAVMLTVTPTAGGGDSRLIENPDDSARMSTFVPGPDKHATTSLGPVCVDKSGSVTIKRVKPVGATGGLAVVDFAFVSPTVEMPAGGPGKLDDIAGKSHTVETSQTCTTQEESQPLVLELLKPGLHDASARAFDVFYTGGGSNEHSIRVNWGINLCEGTATSEASCALPE